MFYVGGLMGSFANLILDPRTHHILRQFVSLDLLGMQLSKLFLR